MYVTFAVGLRIVGGFSISLLLAVIGLVSVWVLFFYMDASWPRRVFFLLWFSMAGVGAGVGSFLAWLEDEPRKIVLGSQLLMLLAIGVGAAWGGYFFRQSLLPEQATFTSNTLSVAAVMASTLVTNMVATGLGVFRHSRAGW